MARRYHVTPLPSEGPARLPADVGHHLIRVMRARVGETVILFDGEGRECDARVSDVAGSGHHLQVEAEVGDARTAAREPAVRVEVAFAPPKGHRNDWVFEHGTEVGIAAFRPVHTARSVASKPGTDRAERWQRVLIAATGQCDRGHIPRLDPMMDLHELLANDDLPDERYVAHPDGPPLGPARSDAVLLLVGPEGGLTEVEVESAESNGFERRSLGVTTLRTETAVVAGAVLLLQPRVE